MKIYYLYVKTHSVTGFKYLGQTTRNPFIYKGSGKWWQRHLRVHGNDHKTEIIRECYSKEEISYWGQHYSELWDVVKSKKWANLKPESGNGGFSKEALLKGQMARNSAKQSATLRARFQDPIFRQSMYERQKNPKSIAKLRKSLKVAWQNPERRAKNLGKNNTSYDHTVYTFIHKNGTLEKCTRNDLEIKYNLQQPNLSALIKGRLKTHKGWSVVANP